MASMKEVAERAGVSIATVSHVFNKTRKVNTDTMERVLQVSRELGYASGPTSREAGKHHQDILGLIVSDIQNPFFTEMIKGFQDQALIHDKEPVIMNTNYDPLRTLNCVKRLVRLGVTGVAVLTSEIHPLVPETFVSNGICSVYLDAPKVGPLVGSINLDYADGIIQAIEHLKGLGHHRIGYIGSQLELDVIKVRKQAFLAHAEQAADELTVAQNVIETEGTVEGGYFACSKLYGRMAPTAIVCSNDLLAIGVLHYASDQGIQVPGQLSVVGFDNISFSKFTIPELTTVDLPKLECGRLAFEVLKELMDQRGAPGREVTVKPQLIVRQSTAPAAG